MGSSALEIEMKEKEITIKDEEKDTERESKPVIITTPKKNDLNTKLVKELSDEKFKGILTIHEISNERIGILKNNSLLIFSLNNYEIINIILIEPKNLISCAENKRNLSFKRFHRIKK